MYASRPLSPAAPQHSLPSGRYSLLGPDFHRLDRTSLRLAVAVGTRVRLAPPAQIRTCSFPAYGLYGAFFVKGASHIFAAVTSFFCSTRKHSSVPTADHHHRRAQRGSRTALLQRRRTRAWRQAARDRVVCRMMIRGEPAIGHELSRANHACIRLNPYRAPTMKRSYASTGKAPEAVGSILPDMLATYGLDKPKNSANPLRLCTNFVHTLGRAVCFGEASGKPRPAT